MGNCLKTQLKEVVQNGDLKKIGVITVHQIASNSPSYISILANEPITLTIIGNGRMGLNSADLTHTTLTITDTVNISNILFAASNEAYDIEISKKYALTTLQFNGGNRTLSTSIDDLYYSNYLTNLTLTGSISTSRSTGNIKSIGGLSNLTYLLLDGCAITGKASDLAVLTNLTFCSLAGVSIEGTPSDLASLINVETFRLSDSRIWGTVESLCDAMANNKASGSVLKIYSSEHFDMLTCNGVPFNIVTITFDGQGGYTIA